METLIEVKKRKNWEIIIFEFFWELDETNADKTFKDIYDEIWKFEWIKILLNLSWLKYLNSKSIGYIADIFSNIEDNKWEMYISDCSEWVKDVLELVWITTIIKTFDKEEEVIESVNNN